jgi:protein tyrosine/serine phosphatase
MGCAEAAESPVGSPAYSRPVLVYCKAGANSSGLAAAIWEILIDGESALAA